MSILSFNKFANMTKPGVCESTILKAPVQEPTERFNTHIKNAEELMKEIQDGINKLKKLRSSTDPKGWKYISDAYEIAIN